MVLTYGIPRGFRNLRKNWRSSLNGLLIVASSLAVLGIIALLYINVIHLSQIWFSNTTVSLFLKNGVSEAQRQKLLDSVRIENAVMAAIMKAPTTGNT